MGGTGCKVAIFNEALEKIFQQNFSTTTNMETLSLLAEYIKEKISVNDTLISVGIACFGPLELNRDSPNYGSITTTPKPGWKNTPVVKFFTDALKEYGSIKMAMDTDVNVCALYEYKFAKEKQLVNSSLCYITVGTGVGIGLVVNGQCVHGLVHPEGGHVMVGRHKEDLEKYPNFNGVCPFHNDCVEGLSSNKAIKARLGLGHVDDAIRLRDDHEIWDYLAYTIGTLCANIFFTVSVECFVIGGGIFNRQILMQKTRRVFEERISKYIVHEKIGSAEKIDRFIVRPNLNDDAGIFAAAYYGKNS